MRGGWRTASGVVRGGLGGCQAAVPVLVDELEEDAPDEAPVELELSDEPLVEDEFVEFDDVEEVDDALDEERLSVR